jgi:hypothetical protein
MKLHKDFDDPESVIRNIMKVKNELAILYYSFTEEEYRKIQRINFELDLLIRQLEKEDIETI